MTYAALIFTPGAPGHWIAQQPDGEPVGSISANAWGFDVGMVDTRDNGVGVGIRASFPTARRLLVRAWQLQLSKGGNP